MYLSEYKDFIFKQGEYGKAEEVTDAAAVVLAIKNILLSRKGNFPFNPNFGMNLIKYQFDLINELSISDIKAELEEQIAKYIPSMENVFVDIRIVENPDETSTFERTMIGISISSNLNSEPLTSNFLLYKESDILRIFNETN
jgi:phage baseplate assembly protein W